MSSDLKKFVNPQFIEAVSLCSLRRLLERHKTELTHFDLALFDADPVDARAELERFLRGPEEELPQGLVGDLHRISDLGTRQGLELLLQQARRNDVVLVPPGTESRSEDPKHVALSAFLDHPDVFDAAASIMALYVRTGVAEFAGSEEGIQPQIDQPHIDAFERAAAELFESDLRGRYCTVEPYEDGAEAVFVISHGDASTTASIVEKQSPQLVSFRLVARAVLSYSPAAGRLKMVGVSKSRREAVAELLARCILDKPGLFAGPDARSLYTLEPIERNWPDFAVKYKHDPCIGTVQIVEAQIDRVSRNLFDEIDNVEWSLTARDSQDSALARLRKSEPEIEFTSGNWRIGHIVLRVRIDTGEKRRASVTVKIKPDANATFKRQRFEGRIMELLRKNGFCRDRNAGPSPLAAE